ncbi:MAG: hypothetical protein IPM52_10400 [Bacteroidetes bacterium]|nr:hypothetical protein [Bacteroidota bacterium]
MRAIEEVFLQSVPVEFVRNGVFAVYFHPYCPILTKFGLESADGIRKSLRNRGIIIKKLFQAFVRSSWVKGALRMGCSAFWFTDWLAGLEMDMVRMPEGMDG